MTDKTEIPDPRRGWRRLAPDGRDIFLALGLGLVAFGLWQVYTPAAYIVPGAVLVYIAVWP